MEPDNLLLDQYILEIAQQARPKVCFVPTASGDSDRCIVRFYSAFAQLFCTPAHLSLFDIRFNLPMDALKAFVFEQDIIYVGGGNTRNLIVLWQEWGLDRIFRELGKTVSFSVG